MKRKLYVVMLLIVISFITAVCSNDKAEDKATQTEGEKNW